MEDKSRMARSLRPRSRPPESGPRRRKLKAVSAASSVCEREPGDRESGDRESGDRESGDHRLPHSPAHPTASLAALSPPYPPPHAGQIREGGAPQPVKDHPAAPNQDAEAQPVPATVYPHNIDVE